MIPLSPGWGQMPVGLEKLKQPACKANPIFTGHPPFLFTTADLRQVHLPQRNRRVRRAGNLPGYPGKVRFLRKPVCRRSRRNPGKPRRFDQPVLVQPVIPFRPPGDEWPGSPPPPVSHTPAGNGSARVLVASAIMGIRQQVPPAARKTSHGGSRQPAGAPRNRPVGSGIHASAVSPATALRLSAIPSAYPHGYVSFPLLRAFPL
jgi:hypothetical protein